MLRDRAYLLFLRDQPCIFTGRKGSDAESVVPAHIGSGGKGMKSPDNEALPVLNSIHQKMHGIGEITVFRAAPGWLLRKAFRALAREMHREWRAGR